jgi:hypothetical protein
VVHTWVALEEGVASCEHVCAFNLADGFVSAAEGFVSITIGSTQQVTIDGGGHAVIDAHSKDRMFLVDGSLVMMNAVMQNGNRTSGTGGAVLVNINGTATFENCRFIRNTAAIAGGALALDGPATLKNCTFMDNVAQVCYGWRRQGGAIWSSIGGAAIIIDCNFIAGSETSMGFNDIGHCTPSKCGGSSGAVTFSCPVGTIGGPALIADVTQGEEDYLLVTHLPPQQPVVQCLVLVLVSTWAELSKGVASCEHACAFEFADGFTSAAAEFNLISFQHKSITIVGRGQIIDGHHKSQLFKVYNGSLAVDRVTMQNGAKGGAPGSGLEVAAGSSVHLANCVFKNNRNQGQWSNHGGGALMVYNSAVTFVNCSFILSTNTSENVKNYNDVGQHDGTGSPSHVNFICPEGTIGAPFTMAVADLLVTQLPPQRQLVHCEPKPAVTDCTGSSRTLAASDCSAWQWFTRNPLYTEWAEGKCGAKVHTDPCNCTFHQQVGCTNGRITTLSMASQGLPPGGIPVALMDLTGITYLCLDNNKLVGSIPCTIGQLAELSYLDLGNSQLTGSIPREMLQLKTLNSRRLASTTTRTSPGSYQPSILHSSQIASWMEILLRARCLPVRRRVSAGVSIYLPLASRPATAPPPLSPPATAALGNDSLVT